MRYPTFILFIICFYSTNAQVGGESIYSFLNVPSSARAQYLGKAGMSYDDQDIALILSNPSHLSKTMHKKVMVSTNFLFGNSFNTLSYVTNVKNIGAMGFALQGNTYGEIAMRDINGTQIGKFSPLDLSFSTLYARNAGPYKIGMNGKLIYSKLDNQTQSFACGLDIAISKTDSANTRSISFIIKNIGGQVISYNTNAEAFPFDIQFGFSQRLKHLPFRFGILLHDLYRWDITFDDPALYKVNSLNNTTAAIGKYSVVDNLFRHINFSGEFYFGKSFSVGIGYDHQRRAELAYETTIGLSGFSFGFNINTRKFDIGYSLAKYSAVGAANQFTLIFKMNEFYKKH